MIVAPQADAAASLFKLSTAEDLHYHPAHERHSCLATNQDDLVEIFCHELRVGQRAQAVRARAGDDVPGEILQLGAGEPVAETARRCEEGKSYFGLWLGR